MAQPAGTVKDQRSRHSSKLGQTPSGGMTYRPYWPHHDEDIAMFDVPPPLQSRGLAEYKKTWDLFFAYHQPGQAFDVEELQMCVGDTVAFAVAIMRCGSATVSGPPAPGGFQFRLTIGLCKVDGAWRIQHEHHSVPATD